MPWPPAWRGAAALRFRLPTATATAVVAGCAGVWQLLTYAGLAEYSPMVAASGVGLATLAMHRWRQRGEAEPSNRMVLVGGALVTLGAAAGLLMTMGRLLADEVEFGLLALAVGQGLVAVLAALFVQSRDWRQTSRTLAALHAVAAALVINALSQLSFMERTEIIVFAAGLLLLVVGHLRWRREGAQRDPLVDFNLLAGSLLAAGPLLIGLLAQRATDYAPVWGLGLLNEVGALAVGLALVGAGVMCRVRSTTLVGTGTLAVWILSLVTLIHLPELTYAAIYMMVGGGAFFALAVLLSVYRDRLLALPDKVRNRQGVFRVLEWR